MSAHKDRDEKKSFKDTLNLPHTDFAIRAQPKIDDPIMLQRWEQEKLYTSSFEKNKGKEKYILHDGPPYANGHIHLGHAYNKILKDMVTKSKRMSGKHVPVTPGWDCHGLPIEIQVVKEFPGLSPQALKKECRSHAQKWVNVQREEFKQLGVLMNWDEPYLTMNKQYEADTLRAFGMFINQGYIEKKKKTVPWCPSCQTVLATAEIEYKERKDPSLYVRFPLTQEAIATVFPEFKGSEVSVLIWTTTPWTLPLNRAVLAKPDTQYQLLKVDHQYIIVGKDLADALSAQVGIAKQVVKEIPSSALANVRVQHPFIEGLTVPIILDNSVSTQEGTAFVHCAPGCGPEDYEVALKNNLEIFSPISVRGTYTKGIEPAELEEMSVADGQIWVIKKLAHNGTLFFKSSVKHSYPHCWRCHNGLIFRATNQWFCNLSHGNLKKRALDAINKITFLPPKSINYLKATIEGRLEWCLSRQRNWGVPIPALLCNNCEYAFINQELIEKVVQGIEQYGIEYWDDVAIEKIMPADTACPECFSKEFSKERDILDVWFDSGISHFAVLYKNPELAFPADMYLEGIDQHRGWFQSSLLTSLVLEKTASTKAFLTHGFTVDEKGHKMSKSVGNVVVPRDIIEKLGTDGLRLWVSSIDYEGDAAVSTVLLDNVAEVYRRIRNTCRFLLSNIYDFDYERDAIALTDMGLLDRYALEELFILNAKIRADYDNNNFTAVFHALADYCTKHLSAFYLDVIKDRLYVEKADGDLRRSAQTVCWYILDTLTRLIAPILSITAEQISDHYQKNKRESIHLQSFSPLQNVWELIAQNKEPRSDIIDWYPYKSHAQETSDYISELNFIAERTEQWDLLMDMRSAMLKLIEREREKGIIKHSLDAKITLCAALPSKQMSILNDFFKDIRAAGQTVEAFVKEFLIISQVHYVNSKEGLQESEHAGLWVAVHHADGVKCPRCWQWDITEHPDHLCNRCQKIVT